MITLGQNVKITAPESSRAKARELFGKLDARINPISERFDQFCLGDTNIGYEYVPDAEALTPAQMRRAPWIELSVDDPAAAKKTMLELGLEQVEYRDKSHDYFVGPAGFVFRIKGRTT